jgi:hypothetical protein
MIGADIYDSLDESIEELPADHSYTALRPVIQTLIASLDSSTELTETESEIDDNNTIEIIRLTKSRMKKLEIKLKAKQDERKWKEQRLQELGVRNAFHERRLQNADQKIREVRDAKIKLRNEQKKLLQLKNRFSYHKRIVSEYDPGFEASASDNESDVAGMAVRNSLLREIERQSKESADRRRRVDALHALEKKLEEARSSRVDAEEELRRIRQSNSYIRDTVVGKISV